MKLIPPDPSKLGISTHLTARILPIQIWPNKILHQKCKDVTEFDDGIGQLALDMIYTMDANNGIGLAAPQLGVLKNVIVIGHSDYNPNENNGPNLDEVDGLFRQYKVLINPKITDRSSELIEYEEGCLSVPGYFANRKRNNTISLQWQDVKGNQQNGVMTGLDSFAIQHEIDHLDGTLFIDTLSKLKQNMIKKKVKKAKRNIKSVAI